MWQECFLLCTKSPFQSSRVYANAITLGAGGLVLGTASGWAQAARRPSLTRGLELQAPSPSAVGRGGGARPIQQNLHKSPSTRLWELLGGEHSLMLGSSMGTASSTWGPFQTHPCSRSSGCIRILYNTINCSSKYTIFLISVFLENDQT